MNKQNEGIADVQNKIRKILKGGRSLESWRITQEYRVRFKKQYSDASITARMRQMSDVVCDLSTYQYKLRSK